MSSQPTTPPPFESRYPELSLPPGGWKSTLPDHLLEGADPQTLFIMHELSKNSQATEFACRGVVELSQHLRALNGKTYKTEKGLGEARSEVDILNDKAATMEPIFKPLNYFMNLWDYRVFRWICYASIFFFFTYLLPWYIAHPISIETLINHFLS